MNLLAIAPDLAASHKARVTVKPNQQPGILVPPGSENGMLVVKMEATGETVLLPPNDVSLAVLPAPKPPTLRIGMKCDNCEEMADKLRCKLCGIPICSSSCNVRNWGSHKERCLVRRAEELGASYAREENRGIQLCDAAGCLGVCLDVDEVCWGCGEEELRW